MQGKIYLNPFFQLRLLSIYFQISAQACGRARVVPGADSHVMNLREVNVTTLPNFMRATTQKKELENRKHLLRDPRREYVLFTRAPLHLIEYVESPRVVYQEPVPLSLPGLFPFRIGLAS